MHLPGEYGSLRHSGRLHQYDLESQELWRMRHGVRSGADLQDERLRVPCGFRILQRIVREHPRRLGPLRKLHHDVRSKRTVHRQQLPHDGWSARRR